MITPTVFVMVVDPVAEDVVANLQRPAENLTGVTIFDPQQARKQLELLKEAIPGLRRVPAAAPLFCPTLFLYLA